MVEQPSRPSEPQGVARGDVPTLREDVLGVRKTGAEILRHGLLPSGTETGEAAHKETLSITKFIKSYAMAGNRGIVIEI